MAATLCACLVFSSCKSSPGLHNLQHTELHRHKGSQHAINLCIKYSPVAFAALCDGRVCLQGYGDFHAYSVPEALFTIFYVFINIGVAAYIIGECVGLAE